MDRTCFITTMLPLLLSVLFGGTADAQLGQPTVVFKEDFSDPLLPAWQGSQDARAHSSVTTGPHAVHAVSMTAHDGLSRMFSARLPVEKIAGKAVLLDVWRKAENVRTGTRPYYNAKTMLSWKAKGAGKPQYSGTPYSDFSGTFQCRTWDQSLSLQRSSIGIVEPVAVVYLTKE